MEPTAPINRRELATRNRAWAPMLARSLARAGLTPNQISVASVLFALLAGLSFWTANWNAGGGPVLWLILAAIGIQLRLLCNMLDGLLAIECGLKSKTGDLFNEIPDRAADTLILIGAGYALLRYPWGASLGWAAALLAILTAYIRLLGGSLGFPQSFQGPMAKQHRMFTLTVGSLAAAAECAARGTVWSLAIAMVIIIIGSAATLVLRTSAIARLLEAR